MRFPYLAPGRGVPTQTERAQMLSQVNLNGAPAKTLGNVRDLTVQSAPRGLQLTWAKPDKLSQVAGYRIYVGSESNLVKTINDPGTRQIVVDVTAGTQQNVFVSAVDRAGQESSPVQVQGKAITEAGAPSFPDVPVDFLKGNGNDQSFGNSFILERPGDV